MNWTTPYCGVTHLESSDKRYRATVRDHKSFATLAMWVPGCGFSPEERQFDSVDVAKLEGEQWLTSITRLRLAGQGSRP